MKNSKFFKVIFLLSVVFGSAQNHVIVCKTGGSHDGKGLFTFTGNELHQHNGTPNGSTLFVKIVGNDMYMDAGGTNGLVKLFKYDNDVVYTYDKNWQPLPVYQFYQNHVKEYNGSSTGGKGLGTFINNELRAYDGTDAGGYCIASYDHPLTKQMKTALLIGFIIYSYSKTYNGIFNVN